jgi:hypothetical protein
MYECPICQLIPNSHSLKVLEELDGVVYLYTCPAKAIRYDDREGILQHYRGVLNDLNGKSWIWIFDARDFSPKHYLQFSLAKDLAYLITEYSVSLKEIQIHNSNHFIKMTYFFVRPLLNNEIVVYFI